MILEWMGSIGENFPPEAYLTLTRVEGLLWTAADYVLVIYMLRIANLIRRATGARAHRISWVILAATVPFAALLPIAPNGQAFFRLELAVTMPHFALILYLCVANTQTAAAFLAKFAGDAVQSSSSRPKTKPTQAS